MLMPNNGEQEPGFVFTPDDKPSGKKSEVVTSSPPPDKAVEKGDEPLFNWSAPDSFSVSKSPMWYLGLLLITIVVAGVIYLLTKDKISTAVILVSGLLIGIYAARKPKMINYQLTRYGFTINGHYYQFGSYRSFSVVHHGDGRSIVLTPLKRFMPYMYIYFERDMEPQITSALDDVLPKETSHKDTIDRVLRKVGF
jgi:hypothetical protein